MAVADLGVAIWEAGDDSAREIARTLDISFGRFRSAVYRADRARA
jgi:hypothetical protein